MFTNFIIRHRISRVVFPVRNKIAVQIRTDWLTPSLNIMSGVPCALKRSPGLARCHASNVFHDVIQQSSHLRNRSTGHYAKNKAERCYTWSRLNWGLRSASGRNDHFVYLARSCSLDWIGLDWIINDVTYAKINPCCLFNTSHRYWSCVQHYI